MIVLSGLGCKGYRLQSLSLQMILPCMLHLELHFDWTELRYGSKLFQADR